jgi:hypothetical protein
MFISVRKKLLCVLHLRRHILAVSIVLCDFRPSLMLSVALADMTLNEQRDQDLHWPLPEARFRVLYLPVSWLSKLQLLVINLVESLGAIVFTLIYYIATPILPLFQSPLRSWKISIQVILRKRSRHHNLATMLHSMCFAITVVR